MMDDPNIIPKFCAGGRCEDGCVVEPPGCGFPDEGNLAVQGILTAERTDS